MLAAVFKEDRDNSCAVFGNWWSVKIERDHSSEPQSYIQIVNVKLQTFNKAEKHRAPVGTIGHYEDMDAHLRQYCDCDKEWSTCDKNRRTTASGRLHNFVSQFLL